MPVSFLPYFAVAGKFWQMIGDIDTERLVHVLAIFFTAGDAPFNRSMTGGLLG